MKIALVNPPWSFEGSIYFGCREPHLPLEYGYAKALLARDGHDVRIVDGQLDGLTFDDLRGLVEAFSPDVVVVTTAPSYLFWRCAPPELRIPRGVLQSLAGLPGLRVVVGPHASTTPRATLHKLGADVAVMGECEEVLPKLVSTPRSRWHELTSIAYVDDGNVRVLGRPHASDVRGLPPLRWPAATLARHLHHHHRFDRPPTGPGAEIEASRGCPYRCTFCAKESFRDRYRKRPLDVVLEELDALLEARVEYVYFVDEIFLPDRPLLEALARRDVVFGVQLRIDHWTLESLDLLGYAGCVSVEAGVESITDAGRSLLAKRCKMSTEELTALLIAAKQRIPFVQANLLDAGTDDPGAVDQWRDSLRAHGVWANEPVPMFLYPGSPGYTQKWGDPDDQAWERAHAHYLSRFDHFSDIQEGRPRPLRELECDHA